MVPTISEFAIAAAQAHSAAGDLPQNVNHHVELVHFAVEQRANVVVFPELSLTGYEPAIAAAAAIDCRDASLDPLQQASDGLNVTIIAGCPIRSQASKPYIGAIIVRPEHSITAYRKRFLHVGEEQHFIPSDDVVVFTSHGKDIGVAICADINNPAHPADVSKGKPAVYAAGVAMTPRGIEEAEGHMSNHARRHGFLVVMANYASPTGGYEMSGRSAIWDRSGKILAQAPEVGEYLVLAETSEGGWRGRVERWIELA